MKNTLLLCLLLIASSFLFSQDNPYEKYGFKPKIATMTNGKFIEIHDRDTIVQIGRIVYNTMSKEIIGFVEYDTAYSEATLAPDVVSRWLSPDPLQHMRLWVSPYNFVQNNPIMRIDPDGRLDSPIYDKNGDFLGTDDQGLQGDAIVMNKSDFKQGMSHESAMKKGTTLENLPSVTNPQVTEKINSHYSGLKDRPDYDGKLTLDEANQWYRGKSGDPLFVDASKVNLTPVKKGDFSDVGDSFYKNFAFTSNTETGLVYGQIKLTLLNADGVVKLGGNNGLLDVYDFDYKEGQYMRNIATWIGKQKAGDGVGFNIYNYGTGKVD